jgi:hypothetical protein
MVQSKCLSYGAHIREMGIKHKEPVGGSKTPARYISSGYEYRIELALVDSHAGGVDARVPAKSPLCTPYNLSLSYLVPRHMSFRQLQDN